MEVVLNSETPLTGNPVGVVTVMFTDVVGSTRLWAADVEGTSRSLVIHDDIVRSAMEGHGGYVFGTAGDNFRAVFEQPQKAVNASIEVQRRLADANWGRWTSTDYPHWLAFGPCLLPRW